MTEQTQHEMQTRMPQNPINDHGIIKHLQGLASAPKKKKEIKKAEFFIAVTLYVRGIIQMSQFVFDILNRKLITCIREIVGSETGMKERSWD